MGSSGGAIELGATNGDWSVRIEVPPGALANETTVGVVLDSGKFQSVAGRASGVALRLSTEALQAFQAPVRLAVDYPETIVASLVAGYAIDDQGDLHVLDIASFDGEQRRVVFLTWVPLEFTWIYVD